MTGFPLLSIAPALLEKTIKKLESKSYFRIRQTCRDANYFIRNCSNISILWEGYCDFDFDKKRDLYVLRGTNYQASVNSSEVDAETLHGIRMASLSLCAPENKPKRYKQLCNLLKRHQITCRSFTIRGWTAEQCAALLNVLKPESVCVYSTVYYPNMYEGLLLQKSLRNVYVSLKSEDVTSATAKLLAAGFEDLSIDASRTSTPFYLICSILKLLCSTPFPKMCKFSLDAIGSGDMPPNDEIEEKLRDGLWGQLRDFQAYRAVSAFEEEELVTAVIDIPFWSPDECTCKLTIRDMFQSYIGYHRA